MTSTALDLVITLTTNETQQVKLRAKLAEYEKRNECHAPEVYAHETYKQWVLERLLRNGRVELNALTIEFAEECWYKPHALWSAFMIVMKYNDNDLGGLVGGTGLKRP